MKYRLVVRPFTEKDINRECPYMPNWDSVIYLDALVEDIGNIKNVVNVVRDDFVLVIELQEPVDKTVLLKQMKKTFSGLFCKLRYMSLDVIE